MTTPYDRHGLWMKAKSQINRSFAAVEEGDFEHAALWAAAALELLGKSALANVNPLLIADPQDDGRSLLIAAGLSNDVARFKSIPAKAIFGRCARAFPPFSAQEARLIADQRNSELHSASSPFAGLDQDAWWERYWFQAVLLVLAQDQTLEDFVGSSREALVEEHLARNRANVAARVESSVNRAVHRFTVAASSADARAEIAKLASRTTYLLDYQTPTNCPACKETGQLLGDFVTESEVIYDHDDGTAIELLTVQAEVFECDSCGLRLVGPEYLASAGLPDSFDEQTEYEPDWGDYGND